MDNLSENVKRGSRQKLRRSEWPSKAPYVYINNPKTRTIDVDSEVLRIVKKSFQIFAEGKSFTEISLFMAKFGIKRQNGKPLHVNQIRNMLTNKFYICILKYASEYYETSHKYFISKKLFDEVQKQIEKIEKPRQKGHNFVFIGLAKCGECGAAITAGNHIKFYKSTRGKVEYIYYRCTKKLKPCNQNISLNQNLKIN